MPSQWLPLADYSMKYKISVSTLRRRIKVEDIKFRFDDGKYFILDEPVSTHSREHRPSLSSEESQMGAVSKLGFSGTPNTTYPNGRVTDERSPTTKDITDRIAQVGKDEPILTAANKLLTELKKAYTQILQEKEEQIFHLREEVTDLKTLVRVLETENIRIKNQFADER
jgi:hypothetical protein